MDKLDKTIQGLNQLQHRRVMRELAMLTKIYVRARAHKGLKRIRLELKAQWALCHLSEGARAVLEAALRCKS